jgi:hypothetical protein
MSESNFKRALLLLDELASFCKVSGIPLFSLMAEDSELSKIKLGITCKNSDFNTMLASFLSVYPDFIQLVDLAAGLAASKLVGKELYSPPCYNRIIEKRLNSLHELD